MIGIPISYLTSATHALIDPQNASASNFVKADPCIRVGFFFDVDVSEGRTNQINCTPAWALLDTGADDVYVDRTLIEKHAPPIAAGGHAVTVNNAAGSKAYRGSIFIIEETRVIDMYVVERDFVAEARNFKIVLGRRFLQFCRFESDGPTQRATIKIGQNRSAF